MWLDEEGKDDYEGKMSFGRHGFDGGNGRLFRVVVSFFL